jgi:hypothetical protein
MVREQTSRKKNAISILGGILSTIVLIAFVRFIKYAIEFRAWDHAREAAYSDMSHIADAIIKYKNDNYGIPPCGEQGIGKTKDLNRLTAPNNYIKSLPIDPWGNPYQYMAFKNPSKTFRALYGYYVIFSMGPDGQIDTFPDYYLGHSFRDKVGDIQLEDVHNIIYDSTVKQRRAQIEEKIRKNNHNE